MSFRRIAEGRVHFIKSLPYKITAGLSEHDVNIAVRGPVVDGLNSGHVPILLSNTDHST